MYNTLRLLARAIHPAVSCRRFCGLNANSLKLIAVLAMLLQHSAMLLMPPKGGLYWAMFLAGRLTAPIMCFFVAEGYFHTRNRGKYLLRLLIGALISHIPYALAFGHSLWRFWEATSVMWSLFLGLAALTCFMRKDIALLWRLGFVALCCLLSYPGDWNCIAVLWILAFGVLREDKLKQCLGFSAIAVLYLLEFLVVEGGSAPWSRIFVLLALPLLLLYNGKLGRKSKALQWGYYLIYPLHLLLLFSLQFIL